jgi:hypothetical protein
LLLSFPYRKIDGSLPFWAPSPYRIRTLIKTSYSLLSSEYYELPQPGLGNCSSIFSDTFPLSKLVPESKNGEIELISPFS